MVYVDQLFTLASRDRRAFFVGTRTGHQWCHMFCRPGDEQALHSIADKIGMKRSWFQDKPGFPHYDLTASKRKLAIELGVIEINLREWLRNEQKRKSPNQVSPMG
jgi:hypothetical protein